MSQLETDGNQKISVSDPWLVDADPALRIGTGTVPLDYGAGSCSFFQLLSSFKMPTKNILFCYGFLLFFLTVGTFTAVVKMIVKKPQNLRNQKVFLNCCLLIIDGGIRIRTNNYGSRSGKPKNLRIRNTAENMGQYLEDPEIYHGQKDPDRELSSA